VNYVPTIQALVDTDHWMRTFAMNDLASFWDAFGNSNGKNTFLYKPEHDTWKLFCWDFDVGLGVFNDSPTNPLFDANDPLVAKIQRTPVFLRQYWAGMDEALNGFFRTGAGSPVDRLLDAKYAAFKANNIALAAPTAIKSWINSRQKFLSNELAKVRSPFAVTSNGGVDFTTAVEVVTLTGKAPVTVATLRLNGLEWPVSWTTVSNWTFKVSLAPGANPMLIEGLDRTRQLVPGATSQFTATFTGIPGAPPPVRINEWMAANSSAVADPADGAFDDWFELYNDSDLFVSLGGFTLTDDLQRPAKFPIPTGFAIAPRGYLLVWADGQPEQSKAGGDLHVTFQLDKAGSDLGLFDPQGRQVDAIHFGHQQTDVSEGRWSDGAAEPFLPLTHSTPRAGNAEPAAGSLDFALAANTGDVAGSVVLTWRTNAGRQYGVRFRDELSAEWQSLTDPLPASGAQLSVKDELPTGVRERFYQVMLLP
jgi:hypothetical protein